MSKFRKHILTFVENTGFEPLIRKIFAVIKPGKNGEYDRLTNKLIRTLPQDFNCLDIGLYKGEFGMEIARRCTGGKHHFFEASSHTYEIAKRFFEKFPNVTVHNNAVFNKTTTIEFSYIPERPARSSLRPNDFVREMEKVNYQVSAVDIDSFLPDYDPDFIKIDIEGAEFFALEGLRQTIIRAKPLIVFESLESMIKEFDRTSNDIYNFFDNINYTINTLSRHFSNISPFTLQEFLELYADDKEFFFIATPFNYSR